MSSDAQGGNDGKGETDSGSDTAGNVPVDFRPDGESKSGLWSDPKTWPQETLPKTGDDILIPAGEEVVLDISPPDLGNVVIEGTLQFQDDSDLAVTARNIMVHGKLEVGTEDLPFQHKAIITLNADNKEESFMGMGTRGLQVMGGALEMHGQVALPVWTSLQATAAQGDTKIDLQEKTSWGAGDALAVAPTDYFNVGRTELAVVKALGDNNVVELGTPLEQDHWGVLQYLSDIGVQFDEPSSGTSEVIDQRGEVANLSRNIVIQGPEDDLWNNDHFGVQVMFMDGGVAHLDGIEVRRGGQAGILGRYPLHFHRLSYAESGERKENLTGQYVKNSAIWNSKQRCLVIHATNGLTIENNICYDITGHAFFLEDGVERENVFSKNIALKISQPSEGEALRIHESGGFRRGVAGFWLTHPDNELYDNVVADSEGVGFWLAYAENPLGPSTNVATSPRYAKFGKFEGGVSHSNQKLGFVFDFAPIDDEGNTVDMRYKPTDTETDGGNRIPFTISGLNIYKHYRMGTGGEPTAADGGPLWNRAEASTYTNFTVTDFAGIAFAGGSFDCDIVDNVIVGTTLNNAHRPPDENPALGAASYHGLCTIRENIFAELPYEAGKASGAFCTDDYYVRPVDKGLKRNKDNTFINAHPGYRVASANVEGTDNFSLAGALWDPYGLWGGKDPSKDYSNNFWVYDLPFLTEGTECEPTIDSDNGATCKGPYFGMALPIFDGVVDDRMEINYVRKDTAQDHTWHVGPGDEATRLPNMRHAAGVQGGLYLISSPARTPEERISFRLENLIETTDHITVGFPYTASEGPKVVLVNGSGVGITAIASYQEWKGGSAEETGSGAELWSLLAPAGSLDEARASSGTKYFWDADQKIIWIDCVGGVAKANDSGDDFDQSLYQMLEYVVDSVIP